jgi:superfamily II RNA helicase
MAESFTGSLMVSKRPYKDVYNKDTNTNTNGYEKEVYEAKLKDWDEEVLDHKRQFQIYVKRYLKPWRSQLEKLPEYHMFIELLYKGVAYHHSGMIPVLREFVEILFRNKMILAVFATESLGVGIDMPTRTTVFTQLDKPVGNDCGFRNLYTHEFMQMAGRAGRRGKDVKGYVVYYPLIPGMRGGLSYPEFKSMVLGKPPKAESQLKITPDFVIRNYDKGYEHMNGSLLGHGIAKEIIANSLLLQRNDNIDTIMQIGELNDKLMGVTSGNMFLSLDKKQTKKVKNELRQHLEALNLDIGTVLQNYKEYKHINALRNYMSNEWNDIVQLLEKLHFVENDKLTTYGKVASIMCDGMPMVRAYVIVSNLLDNLTMEEIVSWLGLFAWGMTEVEDVEDVKVFEEYIGDYMTTLIAHTCEYSKHIYDKEIRNPHYKVNLIYEWIKYKNVETIVQYTGLSEFGNFIKTMLRISSFVEEIRTIVMGLERYDLYNRFENYEERIFYGIVSNSSIYV